MTQAVPPTHGGSLPYRPDIDGLRAISVSAVIFFHAGVPGFSGGYVGVDVFFVISGYLITQLLMAPSQRGLAGQLRDFYVRRCRRILPALGVMLIASALVACWLFLPTDLRRFGTDLGLTAAFLSNWAAWRSGGYFDLDAPFAPLVHLWSIAVEEQFYIAFPLVFLAVGRVWKGGRLAVLTGAALASFVLCVWASYYEPRGNFFFAPTRAWELLLGSLVALGVGRSLNEHPARDALAGAALLAILGCIVWYDESLRHPGLYAVVPCLGAAILLATGATSLSRVGQWISVKPLVFTGLISYSLYLWHLPFLAFAGYYNVRPLEPWHLAALITAIYVLSAASWRYVETPVRGRKMLAADSRFLVSAGIGTMAIGLLGLVMWQTGGLPERLSEADATLVDIGNSGRLRHDANACAPRSLSAVAHGKLCRFGSEDGAAADVVVWGDSHALALLPAYEDIATSRNIRVHAAWLSGCRPLLEAMVDSATPADPLNCRDFNRAMLSAIEAIDPAVVILNAYWLYPSLALPPLPSGAAEPVHGAPFQLALERTLRAVDEHERKICVIGDVPKLDYKMPYAYAIARRRGVDTGFIALSRAEAQAQHFDLDRYLRELEQRHVFTLVDPKDALCSGHTCAIVTTDGKSVYRDDNHLTVAGAQFVSGSLEACFDGLG
jgi:peptidoglycan/LPS O-acetylase OafA/YrhL